MNDEARMLAEVLAEMASPEGQRIINDFPPEVITAALAVLDGLDDLMARVDEEFGPEG